MKNSNSRDKNARTQAPTPPFNSEKLMKTQVRQPKQDEMDRTNYQRPASGRKLQSTKVLPPKGPAPKKQYNIEDNMTESKIYQAKQGLQLIKKKMSAKGLSRQKTSTNSQIVPQKQPVIQKTMSKNEDSHYENRNTNMPPKKIQKKSTIDQYPPTQKTNSTKMTSNKNLNDTKTPQNERKQPQPLYQGYRDEQMQIPIKPKKDFNALLEEQLRKQKQGQQPAKAVASKAKTNSNQISQYPSEADLNLIECRHCDRKFAEAAIQKHENICLKVFQSKRKAFDSAARRAPEVEGIQQVKVQSKKGEAPKTQKKQAPPPKKQQEALPKWKAASLAFRANLKQAKGAPLTAQQKKASDVAQGMVQCTYCGRKFNQNAAARHIPFCETKSKQLPKTNTKKR